MNGMQDSGDQVLLLIAKIEQDEELTPEESAILKGLLADPVNKRLFIEKIKHNLSLHNKLKQFQSYDEEGIFQKLIQDIPVSQEDATIISVSRSRWWRYAAAILLPILFASIAYFIFFTGKQKQDLASTSSKKTLPNDIDPGKYKARLTLSDGRTIILDSAQSGEIAKQGNTIVLNKNGQLVYESSKVSPLGGDLEGASSSPSFNTLTTARGETYTTILPDGSTISLNSASSIKFPIAFTGTERKVEITGEAYFEVAKSKNKKFIVISNGVSTEVLGTHFNINSYSDEENIKVTLLEGSVKIQKGSSARLLTPGQQAQVANTSGTPQTIKVASNVDIEQVVAWKNGYFSFNHTSLQSVMKQIARWYDVDVVYESNIPDMQFGGDISRNSTAAQVLKILERSKVNFIIEGKKIIVRP